MKRRILLVDDEVAVLLTLKAVLEISGFEVETAASAREGKLKLRSNEYSMVISDMRMESDRAGEEILDAARNAPYRPAIALLTAYPLAEEDWQEMGADQMLVKPMHTRILLEQVEGLLAAHERNITDGTASSKIALPTETNGRNRRTAKKGVRKATKKPRVKSSAKAPAFRKTLKKPIQRASVKKASKAGRKRTRRG